MILLKISQNLRQNQIVPDQIHEFITIPATPRLPGIQIHESDAESPPNKRAGESFPANIKDYFFMQTDNFVLSWAVCIP